MDNLNRSAQPAPIERIIAVLTYVNCLFGFIWLIIAAITKKNIRPFLRYHIYQSIFLGFALFIFAMGFNLAMNIISFIPLINNLMSMLVFFFNTPLIFGLSIVQFLLFVIIVYLALGAAMGRYSYFPWVSDIIKQNVRGQS